jgi:lysophospholipase L1-like esterase
VTGSPAEAVGGLACCYGVIKLRAAYTGSAFDVIRASDSTIKTIGFLSNGVADWASVDGFLAGTTGKMTQWYDQSGNGVNLTQTNDTNRPHITTNTVNGLRSITFAGDLGVENSVWHPTLPTTDRGSLSAFFVGRQHVQSAPSVLFEIGTNNGGNAALYSEVWPLSTMSFSGGGLTNRSGAAIQPQRFGLYSESTPQVCGFTTGTNNLRLQNGHRASQLSAIGTGAGTGMSIGNTQLAAGFQGIFDVLGVFVYNTSLYDSGGLLQFMGTANRTFGIAPQARDVLVHVGDSITQGYPTANAGYTVQIQDLLTHAWKIVNLGVSSRTAAELQAKAAAWAAQAKGPMLNVATVFAGTNDLSANATASQTYSNIVSLCQAWQVAGFKVIVLTVLPRAAAIGNYTPATFETARQSVNTSIRSNWPSFANGIADVGGDPTIGVTAALTDTNLFDSSQVHPTAGGHAYIAGIVAAAVNKIAA